jgi:hypothetical protein
MRRVVHPIRQVAFVAVVGVLVACQPASADLSISAKAFSTEEANELARSTIATFSDDKGAGPCSPGGYTSTIDWGDGTPTAPATVAFRFGGDFALCEFTVTGQHRYAHFGVYATTIAVGGGPFNHTGSDRGEITVRDLDIKGEFSPFTAAAGTGFNGIVASFRDRNPLSQAGDFVSTIDWGDGTPVITGTIGGAGGAFTVSGAHTYAAPGRYTVRSTFEHPTGPPAVAAGTITVGPVADRDGDGVPDSSDQCPDQAAQGGENGCAPSLANLRVLTPRITKRTLAARGLPLRITRGPFTGRNVRLQIRRLSTVLATDRLRLPAEAVFTVRWHPSRAALRRLRSRAKPYGLRIPLPTQTLTGQFTMPR